MHKIIKLDDLTLIFSPSKGLDTASLGVFLCTGSRDEKKSIKGIAHFLEHLLFKGTKKHSHLQIKKEIEGRGGALNGFTSYESTGYYAHFLRKNLKPTVDILMDMVLNPLLKKEDIEKERNVILEEIKMYDDLPASRASILLDKLIWPNHPLGDEVIGYFSTVGKIQRKDLLSFKKAYYHPSNIVVSCAGDFKEEKIIQLLKNKIKNLSSPKINLQRKAPLGLRGMHLSIEKKSLEQSHLCIGFRSPSYLSKHLFAMDIINVILGANMSSRLYEEIREKRGLCYDISTEVKKYRDSGAFFVHLGLDKSRIIVALKSILRELARIKEKEVSSKELARAKDYFLGQITMSLERPQGRMFYFADSYIHLGKIHSLDDIKKKVAAITPHNIKQLAKEIFKFNNICISCVGNVDKALENKIKQTINEHPSTCTGAQVSGAQVPGARSERRSSFLENHLKVNPRHLRL